MAERSGPPRRQCGRCRLSFDGDPTVDPQLSPEWWLCPPCRNTLLPNRSQRVGADADLAPTGAGHER
jgi:hypothetical protein